MVLMKILKKINRKRTPLCAFVNEELIAIAEEKDGMYCFLKPLPEDAYFQFVLMDNDKFEEERLEKENT